MGKALSEIARLCERGQVQAPFAITFQEEGRQYFIDGENVPSVTQVVEQLHEKPFGFPGDAAMRGTLIHKACELVIYDTLDWNTVDQSILPEVCTFADWWNQSRFKPLLVEQIVGSNRNRFKTGADYPAYRFQTAGLEIALWEVAGIASTAPIHSSCLYLKGDKARPVRHEDPRDHARFLAALTCSHTRRELYP